LEFRNPAPQSSQAKWYTQFSFDRQGLGQAYIFFFVLFMAVVAVHLYAVWELSQSHSYHMIVKIVTGGVFLQWVSAMCYMIHYSVYSGNGVGNPGVEGIGLALNMMSQLLFMFLCLLISKGLTITVNHLEKSALAVPVVMGVMMLLYVLLLVSAYAWTDPASTVYFFDSIVGFLIVASRVVIYIWFCYSLWEIFQIEVEIEKKRFYSIFGGLASGWFLFLPFIVLIALGIAEWNRFGVVTGLSLAVDASAWILMVILFWPSRIEKYFAVRPTPLGASMKGGSTSTAEGNYDSL